KFVNTRYVFGVYKCAHDFCNGNQLIVIITFNFNIDRGAYWRSSSVFFYGDQDPGMNADQGFMNLLAQKLTVATSSEFEFAHGSGNLGFMRHFSSRSHIRSWVSSTFTYL